MFKLYGKCVINYKYYLRGESNGSWPLRGPLARRRFVTLRKRSYYIRSGRGGLILPEPTGWKKRFGSAVNYIIISYRTAKNSFLTSCQHSMEWMDEPNWSRIASGVIVELQTFNIFLCWIYWDELGRRNLF